MLKRFIRQRLPSNYHEQTYESPYWFVRIPHQMRFRTARDAVLSRAPTSLLDYGAGDGKLILDLIDAGLTTENVVAYEPSEGVQSDLRATLEARGLSGRVRVVGDRTALDVESFDFIACLNVLEHMPLPERQSFYCVCDNTLQRDGSIFIDVPVEIGPTLLIKNATRVLLKGRTREYDGSTLLRLAAGAKMYDPSRFDPTDTRTFINKHRGFDYRLFREELSYRFEIVDELRSPFPGLPAWLGNQEVYFHATRRVTS